MFDKFLHLIILKKGNQFNSANERNRLQSNDRECGFNNGEINRTFSNTELNYSHYLYFNVSIRTNQFVYSQTDKYTPQQQKLHNYIKSMHNRGMLYKRITKLLNEKNIITHKV